MHHAHQVPLAGACACRNVASKSGHVVEGKQTVLLQFCEEPPMLALNSQKTLPVLIGRYNAVQCVRSNHLCPVPSSYYGTQSQLKMLPLRSIR